MNETRPEIAYVRRQIEARWFTEAIYFGVLEVMRDPSAELHLYLGIACCGAVAPLAEVQRVLHGASTKPAGVGCSLGTTTRQVYEGFFHLVEAVRQESGIRVPNALRPVVATVLDDLQWYLRDDFKGYASHGCHGLKEAAVGATVLLNRLAGGGELRLREGEVRFAEEMIAEELSRSGGDAEFYRARSA